MTNSPCVNRDYSSLETANRKSRMRLKRWKQHEEEMRSSDFVHSVGPASAATRHAMGMSGERGKGNIENYERHPGRPESGGMDRNGIPDPRWFFGGARFRCCGGYRGTAL